MRNDQRERVLVLRTHVDEVDIEPVDGGDELRQPIQLRFRFPPVVLRRPIARELLHRPELDALRCIRDRFALRPLGRRYPSPQVGEILI
jgi:hypothetical protein